MCQADLKRHFSVRPSRSRCESRRVDLVIGGHDSRGFGQAASVEIHIHRWTHLELGFCISSRTHSSSAARQLRFMKTKAPQFDLPIVGSEVFNLITERSLDGECLQQESKIAAKQLQEAKETEQKQQPNLI
jgi:hypothetical protein